MRYLTSGGDTDMVGLLPEWFKTIDCAHEFGLDPETLMRKPIFWRDRMTLVVEAKREAERRNRDMMQSMLQQMNGLQ